MSRVGKHPVEIVDGVSVEIKEGQLIAKGKIGEARVKLSDLIDVTIEGKEIKVAPKNMEDDNSRVMWGTMRALINNAVVGASVGFSKTLEFKGVGYKIALKGSKLDMVIGFSHNVEYDLPAEVKAEVISPTELKLTSANKELLGLVASEIRSFRVPEPYKGKGIRYSDEYVRRKEGKKK